MKYKNRAFVERLVKEHSASLIRFLARRMKNREDAEDIAQSAFMRLYRLEDPEKLDNARAFLFQVAANLSIDRLRREALHHSYLEGEKVKISTEAELADGPGDHSPEKLLEVRERVRLIYQAIDGMPVKVRQAFILNRAKGMTYAEIAEQMNVSVSSVEKYILEALKQCRKALVQSGEDKE